MDWFLTVVRDHYADFTGRARRREYWMFQLVAALIAAGIMVVSVFLSMVSDALMGIGFLLYVAFGLALVVPSLAVTVRRLHDTNRSGWFLALGMIPLVNLIVLYFMIEEGDAGTNDYGPDPKDPFYDDEEIGDLYDALDR